MEQFKISSEYDLIPFRQEVRSIAKELGFGITDQVRLTTAVSELSRNMFLYAKGGKISVEIIEHPATSGIKIIFTDKGPGIENIEQAMTDNFSTSGGLGLGLSGSKRLVDEFYIESKPGVGTKVTIIKWKQNKANV